MVPRQRREARVRLPAGAPPVPPPARPPPRLSLRLATVAGVQIRVHLTFVVLLALVALGATAPEGPGLVPAFGWLVALFACVVLHELAHSLVAIRHGIRVPEIDLLPIGGVSRLEREPGDPNVELRIAAAGPAASVLLGAALAVVAVVAGVDIWPPTLYGGALLARLVWVNLMLAAFNLLPALPLDGGRVLRAFLEPRRGRAAATLQVARISRVLAAIMVAVGFFLSLWLVIIGGFVYVGSLAEESAAHDREPEVD